MTAPKTPRGSGWTSVEPLPGHGAPRWLFLVEGTIEAPAVGILVVSTLDVIENAKAGPDVGGTHLEWHVSVSRQRWRYIPRGLAQPEHATDDDCKRALDAFRMRGCFEDNHARPNGAAGNARNFWLAVDPAHRIDCECKETEELIVLPDGYTFTRPRKTA